MSSEVADPSGALENGAEGGVEWSEGIGVGEGRLVLPLTRDETIAPMDARGLYRSSPFEHAESAPAGMHILTYGEACVVSVAIGPAPQAIMTWPSAEWLEEPSVSNR